jgi:type I restriction enzyme S subunit
MNKIQQLIQQYCPNGVEFKELQEVFDIKNGYTPSKGNPEFWENGTIPWFRMEDIRANGRVLSDSIQHITPESVKGSGLFAANSIIVSTSVTIGEHALITVDFLANQRFTCLTRKSNYTHRLDMLFFQNYMYLIDEWCKNNINISGFAGVDMPKFKKLQIPIPPIAVQQEIAYILDSFTQLEAELEAELEARRAQYEYYRAKLLNFSNLNGGGYEVRWVELKEVTHYSNTRITATELNKQTYIGVDNLLQNKQGKTFSSYVPSTGNMTRFETGDILIGNIRPYLKKIWCATHSGGTNGNVLVVRIQNENKDELKSKFLYYLLSSDMFFEYNMQFAKGAKMPRGDKSSIMKYKIPIPPVAEQNRIVEVLDKFDSLVNDISIGLPAEIDGRRKQYNYYRGKLLDFKCISNG